MEKIRRRRDGDLNGLGIDRRAPSGPRRWGLLIGRLPELASELLTIN